VIRQSELDERLFSRREVAYLLGYKHPPSVVRLEQAGLLVPIRINARVIRYRQRDIERIKKCTGRKAQKL